MSGLRSLYAWILRQAEKPYAKFLLFGIAVAEAWIFIPADTLLVPMALARRDKAFQLASIAAGGLMLSTLVGLGAGHLIVKHHHPPEMFRQVQHGFLIFMMCAALARCARFYLEGWLIYKFGDPVRHFIEKHLPLIFIGALIALCLGGWFMLSMPTQSGL